MFLGIGFCRKENNQNPYIIKFPSITKINVHNHYQILLHIIEASGIIKTTYSKNQGMTLFIYIYINK